MLIVSIFNGEDEDTNNSKIMVSSKHIQVLFRMYIALRHIIHLFLSSR